MKLLKNKRGDVPIMILVIGVVAVCGMAILSFIISNKFDTENDVLGVALVEKVNSDIEKFGFYENAGVSNLDIEKFLDIKTDSKGRYIESEDKKKTIKIKYYLP